MRIYCLTASPRGAVLCVISGAKYQIQAVRRGVIRFLVLVIDGSKKMSERDMRPSRLHVTKQVIISIHPLSQLIHTLSSHY